MKIGFIGCGNMANALLQGIKNMEDIDLSDIYVSNKTQKKLDDLKKIMDVNITTDNKQVLQNATDIIFICVKPQVFDDIKQELKNNLNGNTLIVSIMAGKNINYLEQSLNTKNIIRVMPNTPAMVNAGVMAVSKYDIKQIDKINIVMKILNQIGEVFECSEHDIDIITQLSGASPAFIFMFIEALSDAAVYLGLKRDTAYKIASNTVYGSGLLAKNKSLHPGVLKDMVTSPAGTTICGVKTLEENGFRGAIIDAVIAAYERCKKL